MGRMGVVGELDEEDSQYVISRSTIKSCRFPGLFRRRGHLIGEITVEYSLETE